MTLSEQIIKALTRKGPLTSRQLAHILGVNLSSARSAVQHLEAQGDIIKDQHLPNGGRSGAWTYRRAVASDRRAVATRDHSAAAARRVAALHAEQAEWQRQVSALLAEKQRRRQVAMRRSA